MTHETYEALASGYALDTLDGEDLAQFQAHLAEGCAACTTALREAEETLALLARAASPVIPPASVKQALLARIAAEGPRRGEPVRRPRWFPWVAGAVAAGLLAFFTGMFVAARYEARLGQVAREAVALRLRAQGQHAALYHVMDLLREPSTSVLQLRGDGPAPDASASLVWNDRSGGHLLVSRLAPLPPDKTYELWTISEGIPRPAGLLRGRRLGPRWSRRGSGSGRPSSGLRRHHRARRRGPDADRTDCTEGGSIVMGGLEGPSPRRSSRPGHP